MDQLGIFTNISSFLTKRKAEVGIYVKIGVFEGFQKLLTALDGLVKKYSLSY
jgi:hypothetical protein